MSVADLCGEVMKEVVDKGTAEDSMDTVEKMITRAVKNAMKPAKERLTRLNAKTAVAAATSMYMNTQVIANEGKDAAPIYTEARKKAVNYLRNR